MKKINGESLDLRSKTIENLRKILPEIFSDNKVNLDILKTILGEDIDLSNERYEFRWSGKTNAVKIAQTPSMGTLRPDKLSSKNWNETENIYIEGDNLEVLKLLQKSYFGKIKTIYIDPPYNTGKDFVYKDNFIDSLENYKNITNQTTKANVESSGRYHTDWLNMMYPRLKLSRNLLKEDGSIFISIDDNEVANLRKICDEVFGEENFISQVVWQRAFSPVNMNKYFSPNHDHVLVYAKSKENIVNFGLPRSEESKSRYSNPDNDPRGVWTSGDLNVGPAIESKIYPIVTPSGRTVYPSSGRCWRVSKERFNELVEDNRIWFGENGDNVPRLKRFLSEVQDKSVPLTVWTYNEVGHSQDAKKEVNDLFGGKAVMDYPKSLRFIERILTLNDDKDAIILDFFSGSATTAHAVMKLNSQDNGNRRFIMIQLPQITDENSEAHKAGYKNICEIGKERIRRAGEKVANDSGKTDLDIGFKVFKLDESNIKEWSPSYDELALTLEDMTDNLKSGRTKEDLLYEILIKMGIELTAPIEEINVGDKKIYNIGMGSLVICLEDEISEDIIKEIPKYKSEYVEMKVVFKETGFKTDSQKMNAMQNLKQFGITDVRSV